LGTDFGQAKNTHPVAAMKDYLQRVAEAGFKDREMETMAVTTPMALLSDGSGKFPFQAHLLEDSLNSG